CGFSAPLPAERPVAGLLAGRALGALAVGTVAALAVVQYVVRGRLAGRAQTDDLPVEAAVAIAIGDGPSRERHVGVEQPQAAGVAPVGVAVLIPHHPRNGVVGTGKRDVGFDAAAGGIDVERGVELSDRRTLHAVDADLLEAELAHAVPARWLDPRTRPAGGRDGVRDEDLRGARIRAGARLPVEFLPGDPRGRVRAGRRRTANERGLRRVTARIDVQRGGGPRHGALALVNPRAAVLRRRSLRGEAAGEDLVDPAERAGARLIPRDPRHGAASAGEVDRRRLRDLRGVRIERHREALRVPRPVLERSHHDLL